MFGNKAEILYINTENVYKQINVWKQTYINIENVNKHSNVCKQSRNSVYKH
jgi:hypothetical protein